MKKYVIERNIPKVHCMGPDELKGAAATFDLKITEVKVAADTVIDDEFAKTLGLESLEQLRNRFVSGPIDWTRAQQAAGH